MNQETDTTIDPGSAMPGLRDAVAHIEAAAAILRDNTTDGFEVHIKQVRQDGIPLLETAKVRVLVITEKARNFGSIPGKSTTHSWREVWSDLGNLVEETRNSAGKTAENRGTAMEA